MSGSHVCVLCFLLLALLNPAASLREAAGNAAPPSSGFSLPIVSNYSELLPADEPDDANLTYIRPKIAPVFFPLLSVVVGVGTGQHRHFYKLALDLVGDLTWIQCVPSAPEVSQEGPIYDAGASPRYRHVLPTDPVCKPPFTRSGHDKCIFNARFRATATAHGYLGTDEFAFASSTPPDGRHVTPVDGLLFGCSHTTHGFSDYNHQTLAGVMSLSRYPTSFIRQLAARGAVASPRFSYCLQSQSHAKLFKFGFLRLGADVPDHSRAHSTALMYATTGMYHVRLAGISLDGRRIAGITPAMLQRDPHSHRSGSIMDVGTTFTRIVRATYDVLEAEVKST